MPLPLAPIAGFAIRYGAVAFAAYAVTRTISPGRRDQRVEDAMDEVEEGLTLRREAGQTSTTGRFRRVIRFSGKGPAIEIDLTAFGRLRIRKL